MKWRENSATHATYANVSEYFTYGVK